MCTCDWNARGLKGCACTESELIEMWSEDECGRGTIFGQTLSAICNVEACRLLDFRTALKTF